MKTCNFSLTSVRNNTLRLRTIREDHLDELLPEQEAVVKIILRAAGQTTNKNPVLKLPGQEYDLIMTQVLNRISELFAPAHFRDAAYVSVRGRRASIAGEKRARASATSTAQGWAPVVWVGTTAMWNSSAVLRRVTSSRDCGSGPAGRPLNSPPPFPLPCQWAAGHHAAISLCHYLSQGRRQTRQGVIKEARPDLAMRRPASFPDGRRRLWRPLHPTPHQRAASFGLSLQVKTSCAR